MARHDGGCGGSPGRQQVGDLSRSELRDPARAVPCLVDRHPLCLLCLEVIRTPGEREGWNVVDDVNLEEALHPRNQHVPSSNLRLEDMNREVPDARSFRGV